MGKLFGTDGIRGVANRDLTPELALRVGRAAALSSDRGPFIVGRDPRRSGIMLEAAVAAGICSAACDVWQIGVVSTPCVAHLTGEQAVAGGIMISASHNPAQYNGLKLFGPDGYKLSDEREAEIERLVAGPMKPGPPEVGVVSARTELVDRYVEYLAGSIAGRLDGLRVVADCANGSASGVAGRVLSMLGATVTAIADRPDGNNINAGCGSTDMDELVRVVQQVGADCGLAFDGDADRLLAVDERGNIVDGDRIIGLLALGLNRRGQLKPPAVVTTVQSNWGLEQCLTDAGIAMYRTRVGDRFVLEEMRERKIVLGGEQSGHIIFSRLARGGDGLLTAIQLLAEMKESGQPLSKLADQVPLVPQFQASIPLDDPAAVAGSRATETAIQEARTVLGDRGRVLIRPSGTEPVLRVLVEGADRDLTGTVGRELVEKIKSQGR